MIYDIPHAFFFFGYCCFFVFFTRVEQLQTLAAGVRGFKFKRRNWEEVGQVEESRMRTDRESVSGRPEYSMEGWRRWKKYSKQMVEVQTRKRMNKTEKHWGGWVGWRRKLWKRRIIQCWENLRIWHGRVKGEGGEMLALLFSLSGCCHSVGFASVKWKRGMNEEGVWCGEGGGGGWRQRDRVKKN